jgi:hypothetical protein
MTQPTTSQPSPAPPKKGSAVKWVVVAVIVIVIIAGIAIALTYRAPTTPTKQTLALAPSASGVAALAGSSITFFPGTPSGYTWTKVVWNFGDGTTMTTSNASAVTHSFKNPGSYLVSVYAVGPNVTASGNSSLQQITIQPPLTPTPGAIYGPIEWSSTSGNQTIPAGGFVNMTFQGFYDSVPLVVGSEVPSDVSYTIHSFTWNVDNGTSIITNSNTNSSAYPETVNLTFASGLHTVALTTTSNDSSGATVNGTYEMTVYAGNYSVSKTISKVTVDKSQVVNAEFLPGNPRTLDPSLSYDTQSYEVVYEIYQFLLGYNGTSTSTYHPEIASYVPSVANGGIVTSGNFTNITFFVNTSIKFSNGDSVNAYDVFESFARSMLFGNNSATAAWILDQGLLPGLSIYGPFDTSYFWIHHAITYDNSTQTVTFHLLPSTPVIANVSYVGSSSQNVTAQFSNELAGFMNETQVSTVKVYNYGVTGIFFQFLAGPTVSMIQDASYLAAHGAAPGNSTTSFQYFSNSATTPSSVPNWNQFIKNNPMGTGPYQLTLNEPGEIVLTLNTYYDQTQNGVAAANLIPKIILEYLSNQQEAVSQLQSGYAQFALGTATVTEIPLMQSLVSSGTLSSQIATQMDTFFWAFNFDINVTGAKTLDSKFNAPASFFDNLSVRAAFTYAFNFSYYINDLNSADGIPLLAAESGILPTGIGNFPANITNIGPNPANQMNADVALAEHYWNQTNYSQSSTVYHIPIVDASGSVSQDAMVGVWASVLNTVTGGKVQIDLVDIPFGQEVTDTSLGGPGSNPMPIYYLGWIDDYPAAADFTAPIIGHLGIYSYPDGVDPAVFNNTAWFTSQGMSTAQIADMNAQWGMITTMWNALDNANTQPPTAAGNTQVTLDNYIAMKADINMFLYVGTVQGVGPAYYSSSFVPSSLLPTENVAVGWSFVIYSALQYA